MITEKSSAVDILDPFLTLKGLELYIEETNRLQKNKRSFI